MTQQYKDTLEQMPEGELEILKNLDMIKFGRLTNKQAKEVAEPVKPASTIGRNDPCPCGSGKKYKFCCLK